MEDPIVASEVCSAIYSEEERLKIKPAFLPVHVAIIMDGNRRWAKKLGKTTIEGHAKGADTLIEITKAAKEIGVKVLTAYAFSTENWRRAPFEIEALFALFECILEQYKEEMFQNGIRLGFIGNKEGLPESLQEKLLQVQLLTAECVEIDLVLAINYSSRNEICRATQRLCEDVKSEKLKSCEITEKIFSSYLDTAAWPDVDMFIRTSGEIRTSNFMVWQSIYAEMHFIETFWPDFTPKELLNAILDFQSRHRRIGA